MRAVAITGRRLLGALPRGPQDPGRLQPPGSGGWRARVCQIGAAPELPEVLGHVAITAAAGF